VTNKDRSQIASLASGKGFLRGVSGEEVDTLRGIPRQWKCRTCKHEGCDLGVKTLDSVTGALRAPASDFGCVMWEAK
jgi:hypothetical protein